MPAHRLRCGWIVHDDGLGRHDHTLQHGVFKIAGIRSRASPVLPQLACQVAGPFAVVEDKFFDVGRLGKRTQEEVLQHGVVQDHHSGFSQSSRIDFAMQVVIAEMIEVHVARQVRQHFPRLLHLCQQRGGVVGDTRGGRRQG